MRQIAILSTFVLALTLLGCGIQVDHGDSYAPKESTRSTGSASRTSTAPAATGDSIRVASFNIQVFGESKIGKPEVVRVLADVVRRFDVVAIQEIRCKDQTLMDRFLAAVNAGGHHYDYVLGPRLGRTSSKEQYAFVFNTQSLTVNRETVYTVPDPDDLLHREPLVASFQVRGTPSETAFSFTLVNIHTDPDETDEELDALGEMFTYVQQMDSAEDDVIVLGDLNVDEYHLGKLGRLPNIHYAIAGQTTNTRGSKSYDNLVFDSSVTTEYQQQSGVLNLLSTYNLCMDDALDVSDHFPVWAAFSTVETNRAGSVAARPTEAPASAR